MKFTDRYIKIPITLQDKTQLEQGLNTVDEVPAYIKILPTQIESYRPASDSEVDDMEELKSTCFTTKTGTEYLVDMTINEFEKLLNDFEG